MGSKRAEHLALPIRILTGDGARVALQRCPILAPAPVTLAQAANRTQTTTIFALAFGVGF